MTDKAPVHPAPAGKGSVWEIFRVFLKLGTTSFGGPVAHLGYFRTELVERRKWVSDGQYADLVALCQFLPGPASSQVGFGLGLYRAGMRGAVAAFLAFTLPSAALMVAFAYGASWFTGTVGQGLLSGLMVVAVAIVAQAVLGMARTLTPNARRAAIAVAAAPVALLLAGSAGQIIAIALGAVAGLLFCRGMTAPPGGTLHFPVRRGVGIASLVTFAVVLLGVPLLATLVASPGLLLFEAFYRAGSLVFGGGHVVLPLLQAGVVDPGWVTDPAFLTGYGAAQAVPGPLFTFSAYLGALSTTGPGGVLGAVIALVGIFLPGYLLLVGVVPFWNTLRPRTWAQAMMRGANAAVVGILAAALCTPVFTTAITGPGPFALAVACFVLLVSWKLAPWVVVILGAVGGVLLAVMG